MNNGCYTPFPTLTQEPPASARDLANEVARAKAREAEIAASIPSPDSFATAASVAAATQQATAASESAASAAAAAESAASRAETLAGSAVTQEAMAAASAQQTVATAAQNARIAALEASINTLRSSLADLTSQLSVLRSELVVGAVNAVSGSGGIGGSVQSVVTQVVDEKVSAAVQAQLSTIGARLTAVEGVAANAKSDASKASTMVQTTPALTGTGQSLGRYALFLDTAGRARIFPFTTALDGSLAISSNEATSLSPLVSNAEVVVNGIPLPANGMGITLTGADIQTGRLGRTLDSVLNRDGNAAVLYYRGSWQSNSNLAYGPSDANARIGDLVVLSRQETVNSVSLQAGTAIFYDGDLWKPLGGGGGGSAADASQVPMSSNWNGQPNVEAVLNEIKSDISSLMSYVGYSPYSH